MKKPSNDLTNTLRSQLKMIGLLAIFLPFLSAGFAWLFQFFPSSISETYYLCSKPFLIGILMAASFYMVSYQGYDKTDKWLSTISGIFGIMIILFPCSPTHAEYIYNYPNDGVGFLNLTTQVSNLIHSTSAVLFFLLQTYIIGVQFRKGSLNPTPNKNKRNKIYTWCALSIIISTVCLIGLNFIFHFKSFVWLCEVVPLVALGLAYTVKAQSWKWLND